MSPTRRALAAGLVAAAALAVAVPAAGAITVPIAPARGLDLSSAGGTPPVPQPPMGLEPPSAIVARSIGSAGAGGA
jgi:hypothetical protein